MNTERQSNRILDYIRLSRIEFWPAILVGLLPSMLLGFGSLKDIPRLNLQETLIVTEAILAVFLSYSFGFLVNCWSDFEVDQLGKQHLSTAIKRFSENRNAILLLGILNGTLSLIIMSYVSFQINDILPIVLLVIGLLLGLTYSVDPPRFKSNPYLHPLITLPTATFPGFVMILITAHFSSRKTPWVPVLVIVLGISLMHYGLVLVNQIEDLEEDKHLGINTPAVVLGDSRTMGLILFLTILGMIIVLWGFASLIFDQVSSLLKVLFLLFSLVPSYVILRVALLLRSNLSPAKLKAFAQELQTFHLVELLGFLGLSTLYAIAF